MEMEKDFQAAAAWYRKAAEQGLPQAQNNLGMCYLQGKGMEKDELQGVMWIFKAARQGFSPAQETLLHIPGAGNSATQTALEEIKKILRNDIRQNKNVAENEKLLRLIRKAESENQEQLTESGALEQAAEQGDAAAQCKLASMYAGKDGRKAFLWASRAAHQGSPRGMALLGECYYRSIGTVQDIPKAKEWLSKGAERKDPSAQYNLGFLYSRGDGVEKNAEQAFMWYRKSAQQGFPAAQDMVGICYLEGLGVEKNEKEAITWLQKGAQQAQTGAQYNLGV